MGSPQESDSFTGIRDKTFKMGTERIKSGWKGADDDKRTYLWYHLMDKVAQALNLNPAFAAPNIDPNTDEGCAQLIDCGLDNGSKIVERMRAERAAVEEALGWADIAKAEADSFVDQQGMRAGASYLATSYVASGDVGKKAYERVFQRLKLLRLPEKFGGSEVPRCVRV